MVYEAANESKAMDKSCKMDADRLDKVSALAMTLAASDDCCALLLTTFDIVHDAVILGLRYLRTLIGVRLEWVANHMSISLR